MKSKSLMHRAIAAGLLFLAVSSLGFAEIKVATLNCFLLFSPSNTEKTAMKRAPVTPDVYEDKIGNLARMIAESGVDFAGLQEIGSKTEVSDLAMALEGITGSRWAVCFAQGRDTYTGEDVGAVVRERAGLRLVNARRVNDLSGLSKHLIVTVRADGREYKIAVVHLIRPIRESGFQKHANQLAALNAWARAAGDAVLVMGDFNDTGKALLPLCSAGELTQWAPTHLSGRAFDNIYSSPAPNRADVHRPGYQKKPNKQTVALWTDHYLLEATIP